MKSKSLSHFHVPLRVCMKGNSFSSTVELIQYKHFWDLQELFRILIFRITGAFSYKSLLGNGPTNSDDFSDYRIEFYCISVM